jgi:hypothetical protein
VALAHVEADDEAVVAAMASTDDVLAGAGELGEAHVGSLLRVVVVVGLRLLEDIGVASPGGDVGVGSLQRRQGRPQTGVLARGASEGTAHVVHLLLRG